MTYSNYVGETEEQKQDDGEKKEDTQPQQQEAGPSQPAFKFL